MPGQLPLLVERSMACRAFMKAPLTLWFESPANSPIPRRERQQFRYLLPAAGHFSALLAVGPFA